MPRFLVLRHGDDIPLGLLGDAIEHAGVDVDEVWLHSGDPLPPLDGYAGLVVLGGVMGAYDEDVHPWLADEKRLILAARERNLPMLGICLGSQLFAEVMGGSAYLAPEGPEIQHLAPELTSEGLADPVLSHFDAPVISWHQDTWEPPPGAVVLARSERFPHAFRIGNAVGIQAHPEAGERIVRDWLSHDDPRQMLERSGTDADSLLRAVMEGEAIQREMALRMFGAWVEEALGHGSA